MKALSCEKPHPRKESLPYTFVKVQTRHCKHSEAEQRLTAPQTAELEFKPSPPHSRVLVKSLSILMKNLIQRRDSVLDLRSSPNRAILTVHTQSQNGKSYLPLFNMTVAAGQCAVTVVACVGK